VKDEVRYLDIADYLLIAEAVLGVVARELAFVTKLGLAESALHAPAARAARVAVVAAAIPGSVRAVC
jgi:hypothetical protein